MSNHPRMDDLERLFAPIGKVFRSDYTNTYDLRSRSLAHLVGSSSARRVAAEWRAAAPDVIHLTKQNLEDGLDLLVAAERSEVPNLVTVHITQTAAYLHAKQARLRDWTARRLLSRYKGLIVSTLPQRDLELQKFLGNQSNLRLVVNGVPLFDLKEKALKRLTIRRQLGLGENEILIAAVGRMVPQKRPLLWLDWARKIHAVIPTVHFIWVGDGVLESEFKAVLTANALDRVVHHVKWTNEVEPFLHAADVFMHTAEFEGLSFAILEAMSAGLPIAVSKNLLAEMPFLHDGNSLALDDGGVWIETLRDRAKLEGLGRASRCLAEERFSFERMAGDYEILYKELTGRETRNGIIETRGNLAAVPRSTGNSSKKSSVAVLFHRLGPYHISRLQAAGEVIAATAIELSGADESYAWDPIIGSSGFERITLFEGADSHTRPTVEVVKAVKSALDSCRPAAVAINGWSDTGALSALQWCIHSKIPAVMMSESTAWDGRRLPWEEWIKSRIVRLCSSGLVGGKPHVEYLATLGMPPGRISVGYDVVDNDYFATGAAQARLQSTEVRRRHHLPDRYFLASARFIEKKNLHGLIQGYARYRSLAAQVPNSPIWHLVLLGDGPVKPDLQRQITALSLDECVMLPGFVQYPELPAYYGCAGAFIHASTTEQWGLVVNEAMASGLPVLVSNRCGCATDLVQEGVNGFTFDPYNIDDLARVMCQCIESDARLEAMGEASRGIIAQWGPNRFAECLGHAVAKAISSPVPRANLFDRALLRLLMIGWKG